MRYFLILSLLLLGGWTANLPLQVPRLRAADIRLDERDHVMLFRGDAFYFRDQKSFSDQGAGGVLSGALTSFADQLSTGRKAAFECIILFEQTGFVNLATFGQLPAGYSAVVCHSVNQLAEWQVLLPTQTLRDIERFQRNERVDQLGMHRSLLLLAETDHVGWILPEMFYRVVAWAPLGHRPNWDAQARDATMMGEVLLKILEMRVQ